MEDIYNKANFGLRLSQLRIEKGVSARDMSLSLGQNDGYINTIENGKNYPSMQSFFYICEYLDITPAEFLDFETAAPKKLSTLTEKMKHLKSEQLQVIESVVNSMK